MITPNNSLSHMLYFISQSQRFLLKKARGRQASSTQLLTHQPHCLIWSICDQGKRTDWWIDRCASLSSVQSSTALAFLPLRASSKGHINWPTHGMKRLLKFTIPRKSCPFKKTWWPRKSITDYLNWHLAGFKISPCSCKHRNNWCKCHTWPSIEGLPIRISSKEAYTNGKSHSIESIRSWNVCVALLRPKDIHRNSNRRGDNGSFGHIW